MTRTTGEFTAYRLPPTPSELGLPEEAIIIPIELDPEQTTAFRTKAEDTLARFGRKHIVGRPDHRPEQNSTYCFLRDEGTEGEELDVSRDDLTGQITSTIKTFNYERTDKFKLGDTVEFTQTQDGQTFLVKKPWLKSYPPNGEDLDESKQPELNKMLTDHMENVSQIEQRLGTRTKQALAIGRRTLRRVLLSKDFPTVILRK